MKKLISRPVHRQVASFIPDNDNFFEGRAPCSPVSYAPNGHSRSDNYKLPPFRPKQRQTVALGTTTANGQRRILNDFQKNTKKFLRT